MQNINKDLKNKTVFLVPTGNCLSFNKNLTPFEQIVTATVNKVTKTFIYFTMDGRRNEDKYRIHENLDNTINNGFNGGYILYTSMEDVNAEALRVVVVDHLRHNLQSITAEEALQISEILKIKL